MAKHKKSASTKIVSRPAFSVVTLVATVFVFVIAGYYLLQNARQAGTSQLLIAPSSVNVQAGNSFTVEVKDNTTAPVNSVKTNVAYSSSLLEVTNVDFNGSYYTKISSSNNPGSVTSDMYYLKPLYDGNGNLIGNEPASTGSHLIMKITFKAKAAGTAQITFGSGSDLVGRDTNASVLGSTNGSTVTISAAPTTSTPPPTTTTTTPKTTTTTTKPSTGTTTTTPGASTTAPTTSTTPTEGNPTEATATEQPTGSIVPLSLTIVGSDGKPVSGAEVTIEGKTVKTDGSGLALFDNLSAGSYNAVVKHNGNESSYPVDIAPGSTIASQTIQLVAASNQLPVPFTALALGFLALSGVAILYIFAHKFLKRPHLEQAAALAPVVTDEATSKVQAAKPSVDTSILSELETIQNTSVQPGAIIHPQEYSEHSSLHPDNQPQSTDENSKPS